MSDATILRRIIDAQLAKRIATLEAQLHATLTPVKDIRSYGIL